MDLSTKYLGLELKNPIVVGACPLGTSVDSIRSLEAAGAAAVVLPSLFEEEIMAAARGVLEMESAGAGFAEAGSYLPNPDGYHIGPGQYLDHLTDVKKAVSIPVIGSLNGTSVGGWTNYSKKMQDAGADALELNTYLLPFDVDETGAEVEQRTVDIVATVKEAVSIPVSVKLIPQISSLPYLADRMAEAGCRGLVFFNWFLEPDIDVKKLRTFSRKGQANFNQALRWVGLLADRIGADLAASGGVRNSDDVIKQILAGAAAVQICSLFYQKGLDVIRDLLAGIEDWMTEHKFAALEDFRGELSFKKQELSFRDLGEASSYFRAQYIKIYSH